jgi:hypothetical protein
MRSWGRSPSGEGFGLGWVGLGLVYPVESSSAQTRSSLGMYICLRFHNGRSKPNPRTEQHTLDEVLAAMKAARVPAGPILSTMDLLEEPQFIERGMFETAAPPAARKTAAKMAAGGGGGGGGGGSGGSSGGGDVRRQGEVVMPAILPVMGGTPGATRWAGASLGHHTEEVLRGELGLSGDEIERFRGLGAIA